MKVTVSCAGRFHSYNLAAQLQRNGVLDQLITTFPKREILKYEILREHITSLVFWEILKRGWDKFAQFSGADVTRFYPLLHEVFDTVAAKYIAEDVTCLIGWSARSEHSMLKAKSFGAVTILERGSSHIEVQTELLTEEYERHYSGRKKRITHPLVIEKELREYEIADFISVPSTFVKHTFLEKGFPESKLIQNPYGVDIQKFEPGIKQDDVFRVSYVGQMSLRKGVHYLLEAFAALKLPKAELLLVGSMTDEIEPYIKRYGDQVRYVGSQPQDQLKLFYQQSSLFAICSIEEGMAMVQAQAMACGLPLICTTNTGGEDLIRDGIEGFVIPIRKVNAIKEKIQWMFEHQEEAKSMGDAARLRVMNGFSWHDYGHRYMGNLKTMLTRQGSPV